MDILGLVTLIISGFMSCAEFGSFAFVHPVIRTLPPNYHIQVEQGLLRTFGKVMPVLMTLATVLSIVYAINGWNVQSIASLFRFGAALINILALAATIAFNVPINIATGKWDSQHLPENWKQTRNKWESAQRLRSYLFLIGFIFLCVAITY